MSARAGLAAREWLILLLVSLALFVPGLTSLPPTDRDESRYVVTSERMADSGDVIDLRFQEEPRYLQPAGIYWLQAGAASLFDSPAHDSIWAYRIPSLLGALLSVALTAAFAARLFGAPAGLAAGLMLAACFSLSFEARIAKIDASLLAAVTAAQFALMRAYLEPDAGRGNAVAFWAALGAGLMLKGPVILIFCAGTAAALVAWDRKAAWLTRLRPLWGPLITLAIALPWFIAIGVITDGAFYTRALMRNFLGKVGDAEQGHAGMFGYHAVLFVLAFWPGSLLALRAFGFAWRERAAPAVRFLLCWIAPGWIVFEFVATKLPHYVLPTYPAVAALAAAALFAPRPARSGAAGTIAFAVVSLVWLGASALVAAVAAYAIHWSEARYDALAIGLGAASFAAALAGLWLVWRRRTLSAAAALALAALLSWSNLFGYALPGLTGFWMSPRIDAAARALAQCEDSNLLTTPYSEPSLIFLYGREKTRLLASGSEAAEALAEDAQCGLALVGAAEKEAFLAKAGALGLAPRPAGRIEGRNYSNGRSLDLTFYTAGAPDDGP